MAGAPSVELEGVRKICGRVEAVTGISLPCDDHEFLTSLGPSGSGTTPARGTIAGFKQPTSAQRLAITGTSVTGTPSGERGISIVFQHNALLPQTTVGQNVEDRRTGNSG